jgi:hypothetical protein
VSIALINRFDQHFLYIATALTGVIVYIIFCLFDTLRVPITGIDMIGVSSYGQIALALVKKKHWVRSTSD